MIESPTEQQSVRAGTRARQLRRLGRSNLAVFIALFALILLLKWSTLTQPPVWDSSMSVFPAAITLAETGFDLGALLDQPGYAEGGPNVHSTSLVTWLTAAVISLVGTGPALFPVLHITQFLIAALAFTGLFRLGEIAMGNRLALATTVTALAIPVVFTQVGFMYLEIALLATAIHAVLAIQRGHLVMAAALATTAVLIKGSGLFLAGALVATVLLTQRPWRKKLRSMAVLATPPILVILFIFDQAVIEPSFTYGIFRWETSWYLRHIPDVMLLLLLFAIGAVLALRSDLRRDSHSPRDMDPSRTVLISAALVVLAFMIFFFVALPLTGKFLSVLPRYYTAVIPFIVLGLATIAHRMQARTAAFVGLAVILAFSIANRNGDFYADNDHENFALIERSGAYVDLLELQRMGIDALTVAATDQPAFYSHPDHYRLSYPEMGYAAQRLQDGHNLKTDLPYSAGDLADYPDTFVMLHDWNWLGGEVVKLVWNQALADPNRRVEERTISVGTFESTLVFVSTPKS